MFQQGVTFQFVPNDSEGQILGTILSASAAFFRNGSTTPSTQATPTTAPPTVTPYRHTRSAGTGSPGVRAAALTLPDPPPQGESAGSTALAPPFRFPSERR